MPKPRANLTEITEDLADALVHVRDRLALPDGSMSAVDEERWVTIETFVAVAVRVLATVNPSKIRDASRTEEIKSRMDGLKMVSRPEARHG